MLSPTTIHILINQLVDEVLSLPAPTLLMIHDGPVAHATDSNTRGMNVLRESIGDLRPWRTGVPGLLTDLSQAIATRTPNPRLRLMADAVTTTIPGMRLTALAVHYTDITTMAGQINRVDRVDAVDTDGRVYQVLRIEGGHPWIAVDATPDPDDIPATQPGLAAILAAAA